MTARARIPATAKAVVRPAIRAAKARIPAPAKVVAAARCKAESSSGLRYSQYVLDRQGLSYTEPWLFPRETPFVARGFNPCSLRGSRRLWLPRFYFLLTSLTRVG